MRLPSSRRKILTEIRRRGWLVALATVLVMVVAWGVGKALPHEYSAEAVLVVRAGGPLSAQPDASTSLAATYATVIPLDTSIQTALERALPGHKNPNFTATNDPNTAVLRVGFEAPTSTESINGTRAVAQAISGPNPMSETIAPDSVAIARLPTSASRSATAGELVAVGAVLGLLLGLVLVAFWRSRDARIDDLRELRHYLKCPSFEVDTRTSAGLRPLFNALADATGDTTAVVPCSRRQERAADALCRILNNAFGAGHVTRTAVPGSEDAGELAAAATDTRILVITPGIRVAELEDAVEILGRFEASPSHAILAVAGDLIGETKARTKSDVVSSPSRR
jgi:capsular polysaccharide biosynthesis protein